MNFRPLSHWYSFAVLAFVVLSSSAAKGEFVSAIGNGDYLYRSAHTLRANDEIQVSTDGCVNGADTVIFILQGDVHTPGNKTTRAFNDDSIRVGGVTDSCAFVKYKNTTGGTRVFTVLITSYFPNSFADVKVTTNITFQGQTQVSTRIGGLAHRFSGDARLEHVQSMPVRGSNGGKPMDAVLYVIDPTPGAISKFDDDSGMQGLASIGASLNCTNKTCWVLAGNYWASDGGNVAVWSKGTADSDGDGLSNGIETILVNQGVLPSGAGSKRDSDNDGLSDYVEMMGVPAPTGLSGFDDSLVMPWQGAIGGPDPKVQDLFIEVDWMQDLNSTPPHTHAPYAALEADLAAIFTNDNGWTGRRVQVHLERSQDIGHWNRIAFRTCGAADLNLYTIKNNSAFFDPLRRLTHHYVVVAHLEKDGNCSDTFAGGRGELLGNDLYVTLGEGNGTVAQQRGTHVHETGHNLNLDHNQNDAPADFNRSCVHSSVMNYRYAMGGWPNAGNALRSFGYSNGTCLSGTSFGCANTCTSRCVPAGQLTPKNSCPIVTSGPNIGRRVSDGTCDCDLPEWSDPGAAPTLGRVTLAFQSSGFAASGSPISDEEIEAEAEYHHGGKGEQRAFSKLHEKVAARKRAFFEQHGRKEGRDFWVNPENGKVYSKN
jgi:hypothetical protein